MPIARVQLPDGRIGRFEVPEGTTADEVVAFAQAQLTAKPPVKQGLAELGQGQTPLSEKPAQQGVPDTLGAQSKLLGLDKSSAQTGASFMDTTANILKGYPAVEATAEQATAGVGAVVGGLGGLGRLALGGAETFFGLPGGSMGGGLDKAGETVSNVSEALTYKPKTEGGQQLSRELHKPMELMDDAANMASDPIAEAGYPNAAATVKTTLLAAPLLAGAKSVLKNPATDLAKVAKMSKDKVSKVMDKAVKPVFKKKQTTTQIDKYNNKALTVVEDIVSEKKLAPSYNKKGKELVDLPETLEDFQMAIDERLPQIYDEYSTITKSTEGSLSPADITTKLEPFTTDKALQLMNKETVAYAERMIKELSESKKLTATEVENAIQQANQSEKAFYANPNKVTFGEARVDMVIAQELRMGLEELINNSEHSGLKKKYGAYKTVQEDVAKAAHRVRTSVSGKYTPNFTDVISAHQIISGIARFEPSSILAGGTMEAINMLNKASKNPNRKIASMFKTVSKNMDKQAAIRSK